MADVFGDPRVQQHFDDAMSALAGGVPSADMAERAESLRLSASRQDRLQAAAMYSALGTSAAATGGHESACYYFHYAGHILRGLDSNNRAAVAYRRSAEEGLLAHGRSPSCGRADTADLLRFSLRSAGRAIAQFHHAAQFEESRNACVLYYDVRRKLTRRQHPVAGALLSFWRVSTLYSLSLTRTFLTCAALACPWIAFGGRPLGSLAGVALLVGFVTLNRRLRP